MRRVITELDQQFLRRAMRLAMNGRGHTEPNPSVGCVLVKNGQTLGEGWTQAFGGAHAEPTALNDCKLLANDPAGATAYVTLEPCCHTNKKTPPCAPRLIEAKIARVVIGCLDPNPDVNGKGVAMLQNAGIEVECLRGAKPSGPLAPVLGGEGQGEGESAGKVQDARRPRDTIPAPQPFHPGTGELDASHFQQLIAPFVKDLLQRQSYVTLKWAQSADGYIAGNGGTRVRISNDLSTKVIHQLRSRTDTMMVGIATVRADDPLLTIRGVASARRLKKWILDPLLEVNAEARLFAETRAGEVAVFCNYDAFHSAKADFLRARGVTLFDTDGLNGMKAGGFHLAEVRARLSTRLAGTHVLVESGGRLATSLFEYGPDFVDRLWVIQSPVAINQPDAIAAATIPPHFLPVATVNLAGDVLTEYLNTQSPAYFAPVPSADFVLAHEGAAPR